ncbi:MAG: cupin domain-containing protein [Epsilonproteobacteria bacterium]|nr:cupin domain-containing protein [Campylobacterota bacterium]
MKEINLKGTISVSLDDIQPIEIAPGLTQYILCEREGNKKNAIYKFEANSKLPFLDFHEDYDEHVYVLEGVFQNGENDYEKGSYIINPKGTYHIPQSTVGCTVLVVLY